MSLGKDQYGAGSGSLTLYSQCPSTNLGTPALLAYSGNLSSAQIIFTNTNQIRQVLTPQMLADVEVVSTSEFQILCYTNPGSFNTATGLYSTDGCTPFSTATIQNVGGNTNHFQLSINTGGDSSVYDYYWSDAGQGWTLSSGGGLRNQTKSWNSTMLIQTNSVTNASGQVVYSDVKWFEYLTNSPYTLTGSRYDYSIGAPTNWSENLTNVLTVLTQEVVGPLDAKQTNQYCYYDNPANDGTNFGRLKMSISPTGYWQRYQYDTNGFLTNAVSQFVGLGTNATDSQSRAYQYSYGALGGASNTTTTVELLQGVEIARSYQLQWPTETMLIQCQTPGASWTNSSNLVTTTLYYSDQSVPGAQIASIQYPDGTISSFSYVNGTNVNVYKGQLTVTTTNLTGGPTGQMVEDLASGLFTSGQTNLLDALSRVVCVQYPDGTYTSNNYNCCGLESSVDRAGTTTSNTYDALKRVLTTTRAGITTSNVYDAESRILGTVRIGTNGSAITLGTNSYDMAGRLLNSADALGNITTNTYGFDSNGNPTQTIYYPDGSVETDTTYPDGTPYRTTGTAVAGVEYDYGADGNGSYVLETKLATNGTLTSEWVKTYSDMMGRAWLTIYSGGASNQSFYNNLGQLWKTVDLDGVATLYLYDTNGNPTFTIIDTYGDGQPHFNGTNSISQTVSDVLTDHGTVVNRTRSFVWAAENVDASNLVSQTETSADGDQTWDVNNLGVTSYSRTGYPGGGVMTQTNIAPDNSLTVTVYQNQLVSSETQYDGSGNQLGQTTYGYDAHGRQILATDARNGTATNVYNNADQVYQTMTPAPGPGQASQTNTMYFDKMNRLTGMRLPDGTYVTNSYTPQGWMSQTSGSRTYPAGYTFDAQGRTKTLTTWTNFPSSGAAVTTWNYDPNRRWLNSKKYADNNGPSYTYTASGKLKTRAWARGAVTTNSYNNAGQLSGIGYPAGTPSVAMVYDRQGDKAVFTQGAITTTWSYSGSEQVLSESYSGGPLSGIAVTNGYDGLGRRTNVSILNSPSSILASTACGYDAASRVSTVSDGTNSATYSYLANSPLVDHITFANNGTTVMTTSNKYDYLNRLTAISSGGASSTSPISFQYAYNSANQRTAVTNVDSTYWLYGYDPLGQMTNGVRKWPDNSVVAGQQFGYGFDTIGNRRMTLAGGDQNGANLRLASYSANSLNEYSSRTVPGAVDIIGSATNTATIWVDQILAYRKSNYFWLQLPLTNTSGAAYQTVTTLAALNNGYGSNAAYGSTNIGHVFLPQTPESYTYDTDGNMTQDGRWTFGWDAENRLTNLTSLAGAPVASRYKLALTYDYTGRRIQKIVSTNNGSGYVASYTNKFVYDGWNVVAILDGANNLLYSFTWGLDLSGSPQGAGGVGGLISMKVCSGTNAGTYFYCYDGNGNVAALVNAANGAIAGNWAYGPFGELIQATGPLAFINPFLFSTKYRDLETGFYYYGARYYNPSTGRWLSRDPAEEDEGGPNLYGFVGNNPINQTDILGLAFYAIDGTWAYEHPGHPELNANPWWLYRETKESRALYFRGPRFGLTGLDSKTLAQAIKKVICMDYCQAKQNGQTFTINLTGWSRGAIIAAGIAKMLNDEGCDCCGGKTAPVPVNWVGLFDACARIPFSGWWGNSVPPNVAHFDHAVKTGHSIPYPTFHFAGENAKQIYNDDGTPGGTLTTHGQVGMSKALGNENPAYPWMMGRAMQAGVKF